MTPARWLSDGPFTLLLGAGFFGFFAHAGLLAALEAAGLRPRRVVGVSAGALAGGLWSAGFSAAALEDELNQLQRRDFWDPGFPLGGLLRGRLFAAKLADLLGRTGVHRVEHCSVRFAAVAHDLLARRSVVFDRGPLATAIQASCTVPLMFRPVWHRGRLLVDGGVSDRSGFAALDRDERVLFHHLPSRRRLRLRPYREPSRVPTAESMMLQIPDLPRVTPFRLRSGPAALGQARDYVARWLGGYNFSP